MKTNSDLSRSRRQNTRALVPVALLLTALISASAHSSAKLRPGTSTGSAASGRLERAVPTGPQTALVAE